MLKKIFYICLGLLLLLTLVAAYGVHHFNSLWFVDRPNHLEFKKDSVPIQFEWATQKIGEHIETETAMLIPTQMKGFEQACHWQFDTGAPTSCIYANTLKAFQDSGLQVQIVSLDNQRFVKNLAMNFGGSAVELSMVEILEDYGENFEHLDSIVHIGLGTLGADVLIDKITVVDFKNQSINCYADRPAGLAGGSAFMPFSFKGRRIMLPAIIQNKKVSLLYDSGCSAFGLITSKNRYDAYTDPNIPEIDYAGNRFGEQLNIHHRPTETLIQIGNSTLGLRRISYVDIYANFQGLLSSFSTIDGWLGNQPFLEHRLILDCKKEEFIVVE